MGESEKEEKIGVKTKTKEGITTAYELFDMSSKPWNFNPDKDLLYIDAGAWQGDENGDFRTNFVLISGNGVALCNYYKVPSYDKSNIDYLKYLGTKGEDEFKECEPILEFLKKIDSKKPLSHLLYFYRSTSKPLWDSNSLLIVIGDLHLHLFRQLGNSENALLDNFIKKEDGIRKSLEKDFCDFLNKIYEYKKSGNVGMKVVQAGDILDIWEIEYVFQQIFSIDSTMLSLKFWLDERVLLENTIPPKVNPAGLKTYIQKNVFSKICASIDNLKSLGIHFIILQGNHDDALGNSTEFNEGPDYLVHIEHGHRFDSANEPGGDRLGRFLTKRTVDFELLGLGDWFKSLEEPASKLKNKVIYYLTFKQHLPLEQRETYIKASLDVSSLFKNKGINLSIFIMAHTHIPYAEKKVRPLKQFSQYTWCFERGESCSCSILVFEANSGIGGLINGATGNYGYSHVAIDCGIKDRNGKNMIVEAIEEGVVIRPDNVYGSFDTRKYAKLSIGSKNFSPEEFCRCVKEKVGQPYDYWGASLLIFGKNPAQDKTYCSAVVSKCLPSSIIRELGLREDRAASPNDLAKALGAPPAGSLLSPTEGISIRDLPVLLEELTFEQSEEEGFKLPSDGSWFVSATYITRRRADPRSLSGGVDYPTSVERNLPENNIVLLDSNEGRKRIKINFSSGPVTPSSCEPVEVRLTYRCVVSF